MNTNKKIIMILTIAALVLTLLPAAVFAEGEDVKPVSASFFGALKGVPGQEVISGLETDSNMVEVKYSDESTKTFTYGTYKVGDKEVSGFKADGADPADGLSYVDVSIDEVPVLKEGWNVIKIKIIVPYATAEGAASQTFVEENKVWVSVDTPVEITFVPAKDFVAEGVIGNNYVTEEDFYGEGNSFIVKYKTVSDTTPKEGYYEAEYKYVKQGEGDDVIEGFFDNGNVEYERLDMAAYECFLKKGMNDVELTYTAWVDGVDDPIELPLKVQIKAEKYDAYIYYEVYDYTGKVVKPKVVVYNSEDKKIPAKEYTYKKPKNKKVGWYQFQIKFKDAYKDKYAEPVVDAYYGIAPKAPQLTKVKAGKKSITVTWKKYSNKYLKNISGMFIRISTDKNFYSEDGVFQLSKKQIKSGKYTIKKLKKGKKYYVRAFAFKDLSKYDRVNGNDSKTKVSGKVK